MALLVLTQTLLFGKQAEHGKRVDGTEKGDGFLGVLERPDGKVSTELSVGVNIDGKEKLLPLLVPTLKKEEVNFLLNFDGPMEDIPDGIMNKAVDHAMKREAEGKDPFTQPGEKIHKVGGDTQLDKEAAQGQKIFDSKEGRAAADEGARIFRDENKFGTVERERAFNRRKELGTLNESDKNYSRALAIQKVLNLPADIVTKVLSAIESEDSKFERLKKGVKFSSDNIPDGVNINNPISGSRVKQKIFKPGEHPATGESGAARLSKNIESIDNEKRAVRRSKVSNEELSGGLQKVFKGQPYVAVEHMGEKRGKDRIIKNVGDLVAGKVDIAFGHKLTADDISSGKIYGIPFIKDGKIIPLTTQEETTIFEKDFAKAADSAEKIINSPIKFRTPGSGVEETIDVGKKFNTFPTSLQDFLADIVFNIGASSQRTGDNNRGTGFHAYVGTFKALKALVDGPADMIKVNKFMKEVRDRQKAQGRSDRLLKEFGVKEDLINFFKVKQ